MREMKQSPKTISAMKLRVREKEKSLKIIIYLFKKYI